ncbi:MAG: hypothetical protein WEF86_00480 [Gemmatimonadota bacterium]
MNTVYMLNITNGDSAVTAIREAGFDGPMLPWQDVLHEGPVPAGLSHDELRLIRSQFISDCGWDSFGSVLGSFARRDAVLADFRAHEEVILWFEHDLFDQLQLIQLLHYFAGCEAGRTRLTLTVTDQFLGPAPSAAVRQVHAARSAVTPQQIELGRRAWDAFRSPDPGAVVQFLCSDTSVLPFLSAALLRHLEQFPSTVNGLSRTESQALESLVDGGRTLSEAFVASQSREEARFLGDSVFVMYLEELSNRREPLVTLENGAAALMERRVLLTPAGRAVLGGRSDRVALNGINRWLGGVHLCGGEVWRWDPALRRVRPGAGDFTTS